MTPIGQRSPSVRISVLAAAAVGLAVSTYLALERWLPGGGGCVRGGLFDCTVVRQSGAARLLGVPVSVWGTLWFLAAGTLAVRRAPGWLALSLATPGLLFVLYLRGVELFALGKACLLCWLAGVSALAAGLPLVWEGLRPLRRRMRLLTLAGLATLGAVACTAPRFLPRHLFAAEGEPITLPGWHDVRRGEAPLTVSDLFLCDGARPVLVFVYDPACEDCHALANGLLGEERLNLFLTELCRVIVRLDDVLGSPLDAHVPRTPALLLYHPDGTLAGSLTGDIGEPEVLGLIGTALAR